MNIAIQLLIMIAFPAAVAELAKRNKIAGLIGPVVICYLVGFLLGNSSFIVINKSLSENTAGIAVLFAVSLLLLSTDFINWIKYAGKAVFSFTLAIIGVFLSAVISTWLFNGQIEDIWKLAGMLSGVYIGGTVNMAAIGLSLGVKNEVFILLNASDVIMSGVYLVLLMTVAQKLLLRFLPSFRRIESTDRDSTFHYAQNRSHTKVQLLKYFGIAIVISAVIVAISFGFSEIAKSFLRYTGSAEQTIKEATLPLLLFGVTTLGIACSFFIKIRTLPKTYELGEYFLLIFCIGIGTLSNFSELIKSPEIISFVACVITLSVLIHFLLAYIFKIDADTVLITSTAGIFGPAFIGPVASVLKNKDIVVSGLTTALVGLATANFLGLAISYFIKAFII